MKPDWSKAPKEANYHTIDADGHCNWHETRPFKGSVCWHSNFVTMWANEHACPNWRETLEERPITKEE